MAEHEVLEFLLTYAIPRKDTNPTAHNLIDRFGSFSKVVDADINDLKKVKGVGDNAALFISSLKQAFEYYKSNKRDNTIYDLSSTIKCVQYFRENHRIENVEKFYVFCLTKSCDIYKMLTFSGEDAFNVSCDAREFVQIISNEKVNFIFIAHTHPNGSINPSKDDVIATKRILEICKTIGVGIVDHIIFNELDYFSFKSNQILLN